MAEGRRSGGGRGSSSAGRGSGAGKGQAGKGQAGKGQAGKAQAGKGQAGKGQAGKGQAGKGQAGKGQAGKGQPRRGGSSGAGERRSGAPAGRSGGSGRSSSGRSSSGRPGQGQESRGGAGGRPSARAGTRAATRADARTGGFGPYSVDQRDEETRARRDEPRGRDRGQRDRRDEGTDEEPRRPRRPALRVVGTRKPPSGAKSAGTKQRAPAKRGAGKQASGAAARSRRRRRGPAGVQEELAQLAGRDANRALGTLMAAADAYSNDREREAIRILRPLRDRLPDSPSVRELMGLSQYRVGNYNAAAKELEAYAELSGEVDQHPVLMDCYRAQHRWKKVADLWEELAAVSPSAEVVTEGRIVYAGALADQDRLPDALALLRKRGDPVRQPKDHHLRLWYALADLEERAGNLARSRELFHQVARVEPGFADVAERLAALG